MVDDELPEQEDRIPVAPSMAPAIASVHLPEPHKDNNRRIIIISGYCIVIAFAAAFIAQILVALIGLVTNLSFYGRWSFAFSSPADNHLGPFVILVPVIGGLIVGIMARYGSSAIRGHGIPEAMEQVLLNESRILPRITLLKPISSAIAIGTGGPFGAEGPIIATGGALGSVLGQLLKITADERKVLLSAGAAAGMAATFGSPVSAVLLAIELLLFEYRPRSLIPISLATATAAAVRIAFQGSAPVFPMEVIVSPSGPALATYVVLGAVIGFFSVLITRAVYAIEDYFEKLPVHWVWWPAIGAVAVGIIGWIEPHTLGVGYDNIEAILSGRVVGVALLALFILKFLSWSIALGSGTSGGTLAPLFTIGGGLGSVIGAGLVAIAPGLGVDVRIAALVGMAAVFAGASRALLASVIFAFETTRQPLGLLPLIAGCTAAYLVSLLLMKHTIMTEKLARRGTRIESDYAADFLAQVLVRDIATSKVVALQADDAVEEVRDWMAARGPGSGHQGFPVIDSESRLVGVVTRRNILDLDLPIDAVVRDVIRRPAVAIYDTSSAREAADVMVREKVGRLPVVTHADPTRVVGLLTRSDLLDAHERRLTAENFADRHLEIGTRNWGWPTRRESAPDESSTEVKS